VVEKNLLRGREIMQWAKGTGRMRLQWKRAFHALLFASVWMHPNCLMYCLNKRLSTYVLVVSVFLGLTNTSIHIFFELILGREIRQ